MLNCKLFWFWFGLGYIALMITLGQAFDDGDEGGSSDNLKHESLDSKLSSLESKLKLDRTMGELFPDNGNDTLDRDLSNLTGCYVPDVAGRSINIFNRATTLKVVTKEYYQAFPNKRVTEKSVKNLIGTISELMDRCLKTSHSRTNTAKYGFTELSDKSIEDVRKMLGARIPTHLANSTHTLFKRLSGSDSRCVATGSVPSNFDWRQRGVVTSVKNQGQCGSCWAFATVASIESAYLLAKKTTNRNFALSEQQLVDCAQRDGCQGGFANIAFDYVRQRGVTTSGNWRYRARDNFCPNYLTTSVRISNYCVRSKYRYEYNGRIEQLSDIDIQRSLVRHGPLYIILDSNPLVTRNYRGGILNDPSCTTQTNHAVLLVGYTPNSWIIRNSWGSAWGMSGYFEVARGRNMCGINTEIAFALV